MSTILTPTSVFPGLLTPVANPQPIEAEPTSAATDDVDADAPEADAPAAEAEAPAVDESPIADAAAVAQAAIDAAAGDANAAMTALAHNAATSLVEAIVEGTKAEIAAYMPELIAQVVAAVKPRRGRPPGSKNRVKVEAAAPARKSGGRKPGRKSKRGRKAR